MEKLNEKNKPIFVVTTKRLIIGIVVLVLVLLFAFWGGDGENKNSSVNIPNVAPNNNSANMNLPSDDSNPNVGNTTNATTEEVDEYQGEGYGEYQGDEGATEKPVVEPEPEQANQNQIDYAKLLFSYREDEYPDYQNSWSTENGFPLHARIVEFVETKKLILTIGYFDGNNKWNEVKRFISNKITSGVGGGCTTKHERDIIKGEYYGCNYKGYFLFPDDSTVGSTNNTLHFNVEITEEGRKINISGDIYEKYTNEGSADTPGNPLGYWQPIMTLLP